MGKTKIEWADSSWSPVTGCTKISDGCRHCYAERMARRLAGRYGYPEAPNHFDVTLHPDRLEQPLHWKKPRTIFVCSMGDLFHGYVPAWFKGAVFGVMAATPQHTYMVLTKRRHYMSEWFEGMRLWTEGSEIARCWAWAMQEGKIDDFDEWPGARQWPLPNVMLGVTVEDQETADERREDFEATPAAFKFVSYEPAIGHVDWTGWEFIDQLIFGGETGHGARPTNPEWFRNARDWAGEHGIARFFKSWGNWMGVDFDMDREPLSDGLRFWSASSGFSIETNKRPTVDFGDGHGAIRVGKAIAGRVLDGQEYSEMPGRQR